MYNEESEQTTHLSEYYYIITKHKWLIVAFLVVGVTVALLYNLLMKPVYRADTTLVISNKEQMKSVLTGERLIHDSFDSQTLVFNTHFRLMTSRSVMEDVIRELKLDQIDVIEIDPWKHLISQIKENVSLLTGGKQETLPREENLDTLVGWLIKRIYKSKIRQTRICFLIH